MPRTEPSPRPWRVMRFSVEDEPDRIVDANGDEVAIELLEADAALIVDAVNWYCDWGALSSELERLRVERDRLRAALEEIAQLKTGDFKPPIDGDSSAIYENAVWDDDATFHGKEIPAWWGAVWHHRLETAINTASAAIGEGQP